MYIYEFKYLNADICIYKPKQYISMHVYINVNIKLRM